MNPPIQEPCADPISLFSTLTGDEGKGKLVDILCDNIDICARCQGGNNAGHTIVVNGVTYDFHILPSGLINPNCINLIGSGVVVHVPAFFSELKALEDKGLSSEGRIFISDRAHLVFDIHQLADGYREGELGAKSLGTTKRGIGPTYSTKASRSGIRVSELVGDWSLFEKRFRELVAGFKKRYGLPDYNEDEELARYKVSIKFSPESCVRSVYSALNDAGRTP